MPLQRSSRRESELSAEKESVELFPETRYFDGKTILVTGGCGSIGSEIVKTLLKIGNVQSIRVFDINETGLFELAQELNEDPRLRLLVGDVRDKPRLKMAMENVDVVFHAAALKHVPLCEFNPFEAIKTNVMGTQNVIESALESEVEKVITISTDKATAPVNVMGATKLLAERITVNANLYKGRKRTKLACVRFGNVMGSRGSVIPAFLSQIEREGLIYITDRRMTRFIMKLSDAVKLTLKAAAMAIGGEIFVLRMPAVSIEDLASAFFEVVKNKLPSKNLSELKIEEIGRREGEKTHEHLITLDEFENSKVFMEKDLFVMIPKMILQDNPSLENIYQSRATLVNEMLPEFSSNETKLLSIPEIIPVIKDLVT